MEPQAPIAPQEPQPPQDTPPPQAPEAPQKPSKGYSKRPVWQWVVIYVILAIVVYGLIYLLFIHKSGSGGSTGY